MPLHRLSQAVSNFSTRSLRRCVRLRGCFPTMVRHAQRLECLQRMIRRITQMIALERAAILTLAAIRQNRLTPVTIPREHSLTNPRPIRRKVRRPPRTRTINQHNLLQVGVERFELSLERILSHAASACWATHPKGRSVVYRDGRDQPPPPNASRSCWTRTSDLPNLVRALHQLS